MARPTKYNNVDDLITNTVQVNDCLVWRGTGGTCPVLSPASVLARTFMTTSIARIMFTICRYIPASKKLIRCCDSDYCINPFHFIESGKVRRTRYRLSRPLTNITKRGYLKIRVVPIATPTSLLPDQEKTRHLIAPTDAQIKALRPQDPELLHMLANAAAQAGFDGEGILDKNNRYVPKKRLRRPMEPTADKPVLTVKLARPVPDPLREDVTLDDILSDAWLDKIEERRRERSLIKLTRIPEWDKPPKTRNTT
jgi:hypothetical protein